MDTMMRRRMMMAEVGGSPTPPPTPTPEYYSRLVYDGTAYIQTDLLIPTDGSIEIRQAGYETTKDSRIIMRQNLNGAIRTAIYITGNSTATNRNVAWRYTKSSNQRNTNFTWSGAPQLNYWLTPFIAGAGTNTGSITAGTDIPNEGVSFGGPATSSNLVFTGRHGIICIYGADAKNATSLTDLRTYAPVYTLKPCTYLGEAGLWCEETSTFYGNSAGAGTLTVINV